MNEKEKNLFRKLMALCTEQGKAYEFDCPNCGNYAMGFMSPNGKMFVGSCATCRIAGKFPVSDNEKELA